MPKRLPFKHDVLFVTVIFAITALSLSSLLRADEIYLDDMRRIRIGDGWSFMGRPLATYIMTFLSGGRFIHDLSPASQILAAAGFSLSAFIVVRHCFQCRLPSVTILAACLISLNPYALEIYSYRYDAFPYSIGLLLAVLSALSIIVGRSESAAPWLAASRRRRTATAAVLLFGSLCIYPPAASAFPAIIAGYVLIGRQPDTAERATYPAAVVDGLLVLAVNLLAYALVLYYLINHILDDVQYVQRNLIWSIETVPFTVYANVLEFITTIRDDWSRNWLGRAFAAIVLLAILKYLYRTIVGGSGGHSGNGQYIVAALRLLSLAYLLFAGTLGAMIVFEEPLSRPRMFIAFGPVAAALTVYALADLPPLRSQITGLRRVAGAIVVVPTIWLAGLTLAYGNATALQGQYNARIAQSIIHDLNDATARGTRLDAAIDGSPGYAPALSERMLKRYPVLRRTLRIHPNGKNIWGFRYLKFQGATQLRNLRTDDCLDEAEKTAGPIIENEHYDMEITATCVVIRFVPH